MDIFPMEHDRLWSIILAGGNGERLKPLIQRWLGSYKPKQYCAFVGTRSLLQHTLDRAQQLTTPARSVIVCSQEHRREVLEQLQDRYSGTVVLQPANRGTVGGIFLPLAYIRARDPDATVVVYPSDHFIYPESRFLVAVKQAIRTVKWLKNRLVLLGVPPTHLELEYGLIQPGKPLGFLSSHRVQVVQSFLEKPGLPKAEEAWKAGWLWNTLIFVAKVETLWNLGWQYLPDLMPLFEQVSEAIASPRQKAVVEAVYQALPAKDFSSDVLQKASDQLAVIELKDVIWSDWGQAARIVEALHRIGKEPLFPREFVADSSVAG